MKTLTVKEIKDDLEGALKACQDSDITIEKNGKPVAVLISHEEYECYEEFAEEMNMLEHLLSEATDEDIELADKELKNFLKIDKE